MISCLPLILFFQSLSSAKADLEKEAVSLKTDKQSLERELAQIRERVAQLEREGDVLRQLAADRTTAEQRVEADHARAAELEKRSVKEGEITYVILLFSG